MNRAAIYARTSTDAQAERHTVEVQLTDGRDYCEAKGLIVVAEFADEAVSGSVPFEDRPAGQRLLEAARDKAFDYIVVLCADRLGRDVTEALLAMREFKHLGLTVEFAVQSFDNTPEGRFQFQVLLAVAELEKEHIRRRTMSGRARRVKAGKYMAPITPFGYVYDQESGQLAPSPETADVVRRMFRWITEENLGLKAIANRLEEERVPTPGRNGEWGWHHTTVYKIMTAPRYIGQATYGGEPMACTPLVDEEIFNATQRVLRRRRQERIRAPRSDALLRGLVYCRACGSRYVNLTASLAAGPTTVYCCRRRRVYGPKAGHQGIRWRWHADELEGAIKRHVLRVLADREYLLRDAQVYVTEAEHVVQEQRDREANLRARLVDLEQEERRILELARRGVYRDEEQMNQQLDEVRARRSEVLASLETTTRQAEVELSKAEKVRLLAGLATRHAYIGNRGLLRQVKKSAGWVERALADLDNRSHVRMDASDGTEEPHVITVTVEEWWRSVIETLVERIWIEPDGGLTVEGTLPCASTSKGSQILKAPPSR